MLKVWGRTNSSNVMKVLWLLEELGLAYERIDAGQKFGRNDTADYLAMNPQGLVPVLQDGAFSLFESNAILRYLCNAHAAGTAFYPADAEARGMVDAWLDFQQAALTPVQSPVFHLMVRAPADQRTPERVAAVVAAASRIWAMLDARLAERPWVCGDAPTLADVALGPHAHRWFAMAIDRPDLPHVRAWYDRMLARPAYQRTCAQPPS